MSKRVVLYDPKSEKYLKAFTAKGEGVYTAEKIEALILDETIAKAVQPHLYFADNTPTEIIDISAFDIRESKNDLTEMIDWIAGVTGESTSTVSENLANAYLYFHRFRRPILELNRLYNMQLTESGKCCSNCYKYKEKICKGIVLQKCIQFSEKDPRNCWNCRKYAKCNRVIDGSIMDYRCENYVKKEV